MYHYCFRNNLTGPQELEDLQDIGWRYLSLKKKNKESDDGQIESIYHEKLPSEFFIWRTDNF